MNLLPSEITSFQKTIWDFYAKNKRELPWRKTQSHYAIYISEIMLQQTQVIRVLPFYQQFIKKLPTFQHLSNASFVTVLKLWKGLGYNRRALYLQKTAQIIVQNHDGIMPDDPKILKTFPGIGKATACSIIVFSYNNPLVFIETNIRRVFIHHFFKDSFSVNDNEIFPLVEKTLDRKNPRQWYYALMDYGSYLAKIIQNPNRISKHYALPSKFEGSIRQARGKILEQLLLKPQKEIIELFTQVDCDKKRFDIAFAQLLKEGFIVYNKNKVEVKK